MRIGEGLDQSQFLVAHGLVEFAESGEMGLIERGIFGGQQDSAAGEPGFEGIEGRSSLTLFRGRSVGQGAVDAAGSYLGSSSHGGSP